MALVNEKGGGHRRKSDTEDDAEDNNSLRGKKKAPVPAVGNALRSAYEQTVSEDIPQEMLDLLGKLG